MLRLLLNIVFFVVGVVAACLFFTWDALPVWVSALGLVFWGGSGVLLLPVFIRTPDNDEVTLSDIGIPLLVGLVTPFFSYVTLEDTEKIKGREEEEEWED